MRKSILIAVAAGLLTVGPVALAQDPLQPHPRLRAARQDIAQAIKELRTANNGKTAFGDHRDRAEQLLKDADSQIMQAAVFANQHPPK
jgi:septal ring factor EnvC (AmiA/AmiB activator)